MISTQGMSSMLAITLIDRERETFEEGVKNQALAKREIASFRDRIGEISSVEDLQKDYEVYSFVMKTFGLEDRIFAKAMNAKIMTADSSDPRSLVNRLTDPKFKEMNREMGFDEDGSADGRFTDPVWVESMVNKFVEQSLIDQQSESNESVGVALDFQRKVSGMNSWFKVLADKDMAKFMRVALGIPEAVATGDVDAQKKMFERKMDIEDLQDPKVQESLVRRYAAISDANNVALNQSSNTALTLLNSATNSGTWSIVTLDIDLVSKL